MLKKIPNLIQGFSTRVFGDMRDDNLRNIFLKQFNLTNQNLIWAKQVHGDKIHVVKSNEMGQQIINVDALIWSTPVAGSALGIHVADCVPLLFIDPQTKIIAAAHAGWRGTLMHLSGKVVKRMIKMGVSAKNIQVIVGPHIGNDCYDISIARAKLFKQEFKFVKNVIKQKNNRWYLDLSSANYHDLIKAGINPKHIEISVECTHCQAEFFSYRKDTPESFGEMLAVIGYDKN